MHRVITIAREFGSGGALIARAIAARLGWKLLDNTLLQEVARCARVEPQVAARFDECVDPWLHRLGKQALWRGALEAVASVSDEDFFDSEAMARFAGQVIRDAAEAGGCIIVGRGAQCVLQDRRDVFHVFVYGSARDKLRRLAQRMPDCRDPANRMHEVDHQRAAYIREYFQRDWCDRQLYDMMLNSRCGEEAAAQSILCAAVLAG